MLTPDKAPIDKDADVLDAIFWNSPLKIRRAIHENGYGFDKIHTHQVPQPPGPGIKLARRRLVITTLGRDVATVKLEFHMRGRDMPGRQSRAWVRFPDVGWKVVSAHVSVTESKAP
ncbi:AtzH-like domain-containing protein [Roseomonas sp. HF4]|uniref:AtzH-like domain-containing protein n=1 Tax=Roseomonas sp. HF4 TaxID=2562313 RepID=UPI001F0F6881|nr:AtzH-like domain-containing protein [Roseomonas sp. HF4]